MVAVADMAVTVLIRQRPGAHSAPSGQSVELSLTLDAPRIVIGRGKSCDIQLPDPSVSARHASIRLQGGRNLVMDEGSTNGVVVMSPDDTPGTSVRLPPQTPRALADGDLIRIGRVWLEVKFGVDIPSTSADVRAVAHEVMRNALEEQGEATTTHLMRDGQLVLALSPQSEHVIGRAKDAALVLTDELASRRHAVVLQEGGAWKVRDLGSKRGTQIGGEAVSREGQALSDGAELTVGNTTLVFRDPLEGALDEIRTADDVKLPASELPAAPPGMKPATVVEAPTEGIADEDLDEDEGGFDDFEDDEESGPSALDRLAEEPRGAGFAAVDTLLVLVALSVLGASVLGLAYVLG